MDHHTHRHFHQRDVEDSSPNSEAPTQEVVSSPALFADKKFVLSVLISVAFLAWLAGSGALRMSANISSSGPDGTSSISALEAAVFPSEGIRTAATWGKVVPQVVQLGVIDREAFTAIFERGDGGLTNKEIVILDQPQTGVPIIFSSANSRFTVNVLWAVGLAQKSDVLENGPMRTAGTPTEQFASTGGWTLGKSQNAMDYYSKWNLLGLSVEDQARVTRIAETIYRPCCGNSTAFPDCNHGMAMLGLVELMVSQGASDDEIYEAAKAANTYWFPDTTIELATYFAELQKTPWEKVDARTVVGKDYASGQGARRITSALQEANLIPKPVEGGGSCGA